MFVCNFLIVSKKYVSVCVFAGAKWRSGEIKSFNFWHMPIEGLLHSASETSQKALVMVVFFLFYFAVLSLVFELKQNL